MKTTKITPCRNLKKYLFIVFFSLFAALQSCNMSNDKVNELEKAVNDLKAQVAAHDEQIKTEVMFRKMDANSAFLSPWEKFLLQEPDIIDVGAAECSKRCSDSARAGRKVCAALADSTERRKCYADIAKSVSNCQQNCGKRFPPNF